MTTATAVEGRLNRLWETPEIIPVAGRGKQIV
jgi:hypothetical protein